MGKHGPNWYDNWIEKYKIDPLNIPMKEDENLAAIGDIHESSEFFDLITDHLMGEKSIDLDGVSICTSEFPEKIVSVGDIFDKGLGEKYGETILRFCLEQKYFVLKGNHEIKKIKHYRKINSLLEKVLSDLPNALSFVWPNGFRLTCVHAGITPRHTWEDLKYNSEICYVRSVNDNGEMIPLVWIEKDGFKVLEPKDPNGKLWHELYDGRFGFVVSGHDQQNDGIPKFYKHSCNIDSAAYKTGILTAAIFGQNGFEKTISTPRRA